MRNWKEHAAGDSEFGIEKILEHLTGSQGPGGQQEVTKVRCHDHRDWSES